MRLQDYELHVQCHTVAESIFHSPLHNILFCEVHNVLEFGEIVLNKMNHCKFCIFIELVEVEDVVDFILSVPNILNPCDKKYTINSPLKTYI